MRHVAVVCDVGPTYGSGHAMRCLALADEVLARGGRVTYLADVAAVPWVDDRVRGRGIDVVPPPGPDGLPAALDALAPDAVVIDSYHLPTRVYRALREGRPTLALVDQRLRGAEADLLLDVNIGSEQDDPVLPERARRLAGLDYALMRSDVLAARPPAPRVHGEVPRPRVLGIFGGTDPAHAGPLVASALAATGLPLEAVLVAPTDAHAAAVGAVPVAAGQVITPVPPSDRLPDLVTGCDLVLSAAGSSTWELLCLGAAAGLVCTADNQRLGYARAVEAGVGIGLGDVERDLVASAVGPLRRLLGEPSVRTTLAAVGWAAVDGRGAERVVDALESLDDARR